MAMALTAHCRLIAPLEESRAYASSLSAGKAANSERTCLRCHTRPFSAQHRLQQEHVQVQAPFHTRSRRIGRTCSRRQQQLQLQQAGGASSANSPAASLDLEKGNQEARASRLAHLEAQALDVLQKTMDSFEHPSFPCALIAGDVVLLDLLSRVGAFEGGGKKGKVKVIFVDTFHLFPETYKFLEECQARYGFQAEVFQAEGMKDRDEYVATYGSDLFITDIEEYDRVCKVEPFTRALKTLQVDAMINGRRRDHGADRSELEVFEAGEGEAGMVKVQPLAYWEFRDCWEYLESRGVPYHPLHDDGYPSVGDVQSTLPVPRAKWFAYGGERSGRFQGLTNKDGSSKTECGIHVAQSSSLVRPT